MAYYKIMVPRPFVKYARDQSVQHLTKGILKSENAMSSKMKEVDFYLMKCDYFKFDTRTMLLHYLFICK